MEIKELTKNKQEINQAKRTLANPMLVLLCTSLAVCCGILFVHLNGMKHREDVFNAVFPYMTVITTEGRVRLLKDVVSLGDGENSSFKVANLSDGSKCNFTTIVGYSIKDAPKLPVPINLEGWEDKFYSAEVITEQVNKELDYMNMSDEKLKHPLFGDGLNDGLYEYLTKDELYKSEVFIENGDAVKHYYYMPNYDLISEFREGKLISTEYKLSGFSGAAQFQTDRSNPIDHKFIIGYFKREE